jgi:hypothetical protein
MLLGLHRGGRKCREDLWGTVSEVIYAPDFIVLVLFEHLSQLHFP